MTIATSTRRVAAVEQLVAAKLVIYAAALTARLGRVRLVDEHHSSPPRLCCRQQALTKGVVGPSEHVARRLAIDLALDPLHHLLRLRIPAPK